MDIEAEIRSFISEEQYGQLLLFFQQNASFMKEDYQETFYFDGEQDLRIQKNDFFAKVWLKKGKLHDDHREEIEIRFDRSDFEKLEQLFLSMGLRVGIKWFRARLEFKWDDATVCLDFTRGYGYIIELEKMCSDHDKEQEVEKLKQKLASLGIAATPKAEFEARFKYYKENWRELVKE
ncbi:TPA: hypothetical protein HA234_03560 [Candidatus Woesearchaeota archaeon]|nr:hypothetical protein [Candidatus Woesearchaeota archaeon]